MSPSRRPEPPLEILERMRHPVPMEERPDGDARRQAAIDALATAIRRGGQNRRSFPRWLLVSAAALLLSAGAGFLVHRPTVPSSRARAVASAPAGQPTLAGGGQIRILKGTAVTQRGDLTTSVGAGGAARIAEGDGVTIPVDGEALLDLPRGVHVKVASSTELSLVKVLDGEQRLHLDLGRTEVSVPKPGGPAVFSIVTPDSEVVVHGTEFSVLVERDDESTSAVRTTVSVTRGSVFVAHDGVRRLLAPGDTWSSRVQTPEGPSAAVAHGAPPSPAAVARRSTPAIVAPSLTEQNRLFQSFLDARGAGDNVRALRLLDELLTRFPDTPLADQARVARFRVLQRLGATTHGHEPSP